jgi:hypothetical protein
MSPSPMWQVAALPAAQRSRQALCRPTIVRRSLKTIPHRNTRYQTPTAASAAATAHVCGLRPVAPPYPPEERKSPLWASRLKSPQPSPLCPEPRRAATATRVPGAMLSFSGCGRTPEMSVHPKAAQRPSPRSRSPVPRQLIAAGSIWIHLKRRFRQRDQAGRRPPISLGS